MSLTKKQFKVLEYIAEFTNSNGYNPSFRERSKGIKLNSEATVSQHIDALTKKQMLQKTKKSARSLTLTSLAKELFNDLKNESKSEINDSKLIELPMLGIIAAGRPIEKLDDSNDTLEVPSFMVGKKNTYVLQVKGSSMIDEGILSGDYVVIQENSNPVNGSVIVALLNGGATLKKIYREKTKIRLQPSNSTMKPIIVDSKDELEIQGEAVGLIRRFAWL